MNQKMTIPPELEGEYTIRVTDMPLTSPGFVMYDDEDHANVYLNARYNQETNENTADHEMIHIINDDIHNADDIRTVEARADARTAKLKSIPTLKKARDLIPPRPAAPKRKIDLSPRQAAVIFNAISDLDRFIFSDRPFYEE